jgi:hypothetical protein
MMIKTKIAIALIMRVAVAQPSGFLEPKSMKAKMRPIPPASPIKMKPSSEQTSKPFQP